MTESGCYIFDIKVCSEQNGLSPSLLFNEEISAIANAEELISLRQPNMRYICFFIDY